MSNNKTQTSTTAFKEASSKFSKKELTVLHKIYTDLAARSETKRLNKNHFLRFFNLSGFVGERLFSVFDTKLEGSITYEQFIYGLAICCKDTDEAKIKLLFSLYDVQKEGVIEKNVVLESIYKHSKDQIRSILDDILPDKGKKTRQVTRDQRNKFLESQGLIDWQKVMSDDNEIDCSFGDDTVIPDEEKNFDHFAIVQRDIKKAFEFFLQLEEERKRIRSLQNSAQKTSNTSNMSVMKDTSHNMSTFRIGESVIDDHMIGSARFNIPTKLVFEDFKLWISKHSILLDVFKSTFREDIWSTKKIEPKTDGVDQSAMNEVSVSISVTVTDVNISQLEEKQSKKLRKAASRKFEEDLKLGYQSQKADKSGYLYKRGGVFNMLKKRKFEIRDQFLFFYSKKQREVPKGVIFLDGCKIVETGESGKKFGFKIVCQDQPSHELEIFCNKKEEMLEWTQALNGSINFPKQSKYSFKEQMGSDRSSFVFKPKNKSCSGSEYVVEVIEKKNLTYQLKEQIRSSVSIIKALNHPNIAKLIEYVETTGYMYISTEDCKDGNLYSYVINKGCLDEQEASTVMKQLFDAFAYIHEVGFVHRNIKPEDILITLGEDKRIKEVKITNFASAKLVLSDEVMVEPCGVPNLIAPEVIRGEGYTQKIDEWGLGVVMYFMLQGCMPFDAEDTDTILKNVITSKLADDDYWENVSSQAKDLIQRLLRKSVEKRITVKRAMKHSWVTDSHDEKKIKELEKILDKDDVATSMCCNETHFKSQTIEIPAGL